MDRLRDKSANIINFQQRIVIALVMLVITSIFAAKAIKENWFEPRTPLDLSNAPVLLFFNKYNGCECEMVVYDAAEGQITNWSEESRNGTPIISIDLNLRPSLGRQYNVIRAPALILVDENAIILATQKDIVTDEFPLDLTYFEHVIKELSHEQ